MLLDLLMLCQGSVEASLIGKFLEHGLAGALVVIEGLVIRSMYKSINDQRNDFDKRLADVQKAADVKKDELHAERLADLRTFSKEHTEINRQTILGLTNSSAVIEAQSHGIDGLRDALDNLTDEVRRGKSR